MIVLTMIVKNEAETISRCLKSALPSIGAWSIVDTGSSDNTKELIQEILKDKPGKLHQRSWVNFGYNRTESFRLAKATVVELGADPDQTYCLLLDADHELQGKVTGSELTAPGYYLRQRDTEIEYSNTRLVRCDHDWTSVGVTHEYWSAPGVSITETYNGAGIRDHADGGTRSEKFTRDVALLEQGLRDEPGNVRYMFYLAQTYEGMGRTTDAIAMYRRRAEAGGWAEEAWMARLRMAKIMASTGQIIHAQTEFLRAYEDRPTRAEPLYHLAKMHREMGNNHRAYLFADAARKIPKPSDTLFVEHPVYEHAALQEIGIAGWYVGKKSEGFEALEKVLSTRGADHNLALCNQAHYLEPIEAIERGTYEVPESMRTFEGVVYHCSNPSVCGDIVNVRLVNYDQTNGKHYAGRPDPHVIRTRNIIRHEGKDYLLADHFEPIVPSNIHGLEDIRLIEHQGAHLFSCTTCMFTGRPQVALGKLAWNAAEGSFYVSFVAPIKYDDARDVEKNWILWPQADGSLKVVYSFDPFVVLEVDASTGEAREIIRHPVKSYAGRFRGSTPPIKTGNAWTALVHDVAYGPDRNVYSHRWVRFDERGVHDYSTPFLLDHNGIEYAAGLSRNTDGTFTISYGFEDREAKWLKVVAPW